MFRVGFLVSSVSIALVAPGADASPEEGKKIFAAKKCGACHQTVGPSKVKSIADRGKQKGPDLWFAGSKLKIDWLQQWLEKPTPIRGTEWATLERGQQQHVRLAAGEAVAVAEYLMTLTDQYMKTGVIKEKKKMSRSKRLKAKKLFEMKQACYACHKTPIKRGKKIRRIVGGFTGPTFVDAGKRLKGDWIYSFFKEPHTYAPFGRMPAYGDQAATKFSDKDLKLLAKYLLSF
jgi:cytochrome c551/c552